MSMSPQELERMNKLEKLVTSLLNVQNVAFIGSLERRLEFPFRLADAIDVSATAPTSGQVLKWNGTVWAPATDNS